MSATREEFTSALAKGSGRAMALLKQSSDPKSVKEELLGACLLNLAYDPQCENERSGYLAKLIAATGDQKEFFSALLPRLVESPEDPDTLNVPQIFSVLTWLAAECTDLDGAALRRAFSQLGNEDRLDCMEALVKFDGLPALLDCTAILTQQLDDEGWRASGLLDAIRARDGSETDKVLAELRLKQPAIERLMAYVEAEDTPSTQQDEAYDFSDIRSQLLGGAWPEGSGFLARRLTDGEWGLLAEDLTTRVDEKGAAHYLRLFGRHPFPGNPEILIRLMDSQISRVSWQALNALGRLRSPIVRAIALQKIEARNSSGVRLLRANFEPGDFSKIEPLLESAVEEEEVHDLGLSVLDLVGEYDHPPEAYTALMLLYERTPCSICRNAAVSGLVKIGRAPPWMAEECQFDADPDTAKLFVTSAGVENS